MADQAPLDPAAIRTVSIHDRPSKVEEKEFIGPLAAGMGFRAWLDALPDILAARDLREVARAIVKARQADRPVILGMGAHAVKVGLTPLIVGLMEKKIVTAVAMNGAGAVHDFEVALAGRTSEDVAASLDTGMFGMTRETGEGLNRAMARCGREDLGLGRAVGEAIRDGAFPHAAKSILAAAARLGLGATVHAAIGTDIIHMHPSADGAAIGRGSLRDFRTFAAEVAGLEGGVYLNLGSAVIMPEVFLKALSLARNLGHKVDAFTTVDMDFIAHYRPAVNVVQRPVHTGGRGYRLIGHHEIMFPLLFAAVMEYGAGRTRVTKGPLAGTKAARKKGSRR